MTGHFHSFLLNIVPVSVSTELVLQLAKSANLNAMFSSQFAQIFFFWTEFFYLNICLHIRNVICEHDICS